MVCMKKKKSKDDTGDINNYFIVLENDIYDYGVIEENKNVWNQL